jgi:hypothetical protein
LGCAGFQASLASFLHDNFYFSSNHFSNRPFLVNRHERC